MENYNALTSLVENVKSDMELFYTKGNRSAARRARKAMQEVAKLAKDMRKEISARVNEMKTTTSAN